MKAMKPLLALGISLAVAAPALHAQAPAAQQPAVVTSDPVVWAAHEIYARQSKYMIAAAEEMPAEKYAFHPTEGQWSFGKIVAHVAQSNGGLCGMLSGTTGPKTLTVSETAPKADLVAALKAAFDFCTPVIENLKDAKLADTITYFRGARVPRARALIELTDDLEDHYSQLASYLRLSGMLPPSAAPGSKP